MKRIVGYWGTWAAYRQGKGHFDVEDIDPTLCTHLVYSFLGVNEDGSVKYLDPNLDLPDNGGKDYIRKFIELRGKSPSTKFMFAIGGWNAGSEVFSSIAGNGDSRSKFAHSVLDICKKHSFDGFDLDWEYPCQRGGHSEDKENLVLLLQELNRALKSNGKVLSIAVGAAESSASKSYEIRDVAANVDFINLMSYDLHGSWESVTGINSPLYSGPKDASQQLNVDAIVKYWLDQGCPREKLNVGIPLYGRSFTLADRNNYQVGAPSAGPGRGGSFTTESGFLGANEVLYNIETQGWRRYYEHKQHVPYAVHDDQWVGYDDQQSINAKLDYIKRNNLGGVMFWSIETDDFSNVCGKGRYPLLKLARS